MFVKALRSRKNAYESLDEKPLEPIKSPARVIDKDAVIHKKGIRFPEHRLIYSAKFDLDNGETKEFFSEQPLFESLKIGQIGVLIFCGDTFLGFADFDSNQQKEENRW